MFQKPNCPIIAIEEHYWDRELTKTYTGGEAGRPASSTSGCTISAHCASRRWTRPASTSRCSRTARRRRRSCRPRPPPRCAARVNDRLRQSLRRQSEALRRLCRVADRDPDAAADELERTVTKLGFKGAMIHGMANGEFLDHKKYWPIYARAEKLDVPIYLHPSLPNADGHAKSITRITPRTSRWWCGRPGASRWRRRRRRSAWCSPACSSKHPKLKIILGHLGETLPFLVWRIDQRAQAARAEVAELPRHVLQEFLRHHERHSSPIRRCCAASWRWVSTISCSPSTGRS